MTDIPCTYNVPCIEVYKKPNKHRQQALGRKFTCKYPECKGLFYTLQAYDSHLESHQCSKCGKYFVSVATHDCNQTFTGAGNQKSPFLTENLDLGQFEITNVLHRGTIIVLVSDFKNIVLGSFSDTFEYVYSDLEKLLTQLIAKYKGLKVSIQISTVLEDHTGEIRKERKFYSPFLRYLHKDFIEGNVLTQASYLITSLNLYNEGNSSWRLSNILSMEVRVAQYQPILPRGFVSTPKCLSRGSVINVKTRSGDCFILSVLAFLYRDRIRLKDLPEKSWKELTKSQKQRQKNFYENPKSYLPIIADLEASSELIIQDFLRPISLQEINIFELKNKICISVYGHEGKNLYPVRLSDKKYPKNVDLLLLESKNTENLDRFVTEYHYAALPDISKFLGKRKYHANKKCRYCLKPFRFNIKLHEETCQLVSQKKISYPTESHYSFRKLGMLQDIAYKVFFHFKMFKKNEKNPKLFQPLSNLTFTEKTANLECASYGLVVIGPTEKIEFTKFYDGENPVEHFFCTIFPLANAIIKKVDSTLVPLKPTREDWQKYNSTSTCAVCGHNFDNKRLKCFHHDHSDPNKPKFIYCTLCNIQIRLKPLVFIGHDISKFENNVILRSLKPEWIKTVRIIAKDSEKILRLVLNKKCRFLDIALFLEKATLASYLTRMCKSNNTEDYQKIIPILHQGLDNSEKLGLMLPLIPFPKTSFTGPEVYTKEGLPPIEHFYDEIEDEPLKDSEYARALCIYKTFKCQSFRDYALLSTKFSVLSLADITTHFVNYKMSTFGLSPLHSTTLSGYAFDVCMYNSDENFEYLRSEDKIMYILDSIRGAPCFSTTRVATAKSERLGDKDVKDDERFEIIYADFTAMYPSLMTSFLSVGEYQWLTPEELDKINFENLAEDTGYGFVFTVTLKYSDIYHDRDNFLPLAISRRTLRLEDLSKGQKTQYDKIADKICNPFISQKLSMDLFDKPNYTVYYKNLKYYLQKGMVVVKRHKGMRFKERPFLKRFIEHMMNLRKQAMQNNDIIANDNIKAMACSIYGKTLSNTSNFTDNKVCLSRAEALKIISKPSFENYLNLNEDVTIFQLSRGTTSYRYPMLCAFIILELAKLKLYQTFDKLREAFPECKLIMGDTDSLAILAPMKHKDQLITTLKKMTDLFDFSNLPKDCELYSTKNRCQHGFLKLCHFNIREIISIRPKTYSILLYCQICKKESSGDCVKCSGIRKGSGVPKAVLRRLTHDYYQDILSKEGIKYVTANVIRSVNHQLGIYTVRRIGFNSLNPTRYLNDNGIDTTALGHWRLRNT